MFIEFILKEMHPKKRWILALSTLYCVSTNAQQDTSKFTTEFLPQTHLVPLFTADTRSHRLSILKPYENNGYIGSMGGIFPVVRLSKWNKSLQFSVASTLYTTLFKWTSRGLLINTDFFVDIFGDLKINNNWALRGSVGHTSQHLSDDALLSGLVPINYVKDYIQLFGVYTRKNFMGYAGYVYFDNYSTNVVYHPAGLIQAGFEHSVLNWFEKNHMYYAIDVKFREEFNYGTTQNIQVGYKYAKPLGRAIRVVVNYTSGYQEIGQFYKEKRSFISSGFCFDF